MKFVNYVSSLILSPWRAYMRHIDIEILWPICKREAHEDLDAAKAAFYVHTLMDKSWLYLGEEEIIARIDRLT